MSDRVILVPTYNEAANIPEFHSSVRAAVDFDIVFIDDSSPDGSAEIIRGIASSDPGVFLLSRPRKEGLGKAYAEGFRRVLEMGRWGRVFMMDADLSHQPGHLPEIDRALEGCDLCLGSRYLHGVSVLNWSIVRLNLSYAANGYIRAVTGLSFTDCTSGYRGFRSEILPLILASGIRASGYAFLVEMLHRVWTSGLRISEVPIVFTERKHGASKVSARVFAESFLTPLRLGLNRRRPPKS
jgi:dolichol-phosphate mannosyltransferase